MPHQQNVFRILGQTMVGLDDKSADTIATQVAALTYQSQLTASTVANLIQHAKQQFVHLALQQNLMHENMHQIIIQVNTLSFNQSNAGQGRLGALTAEAADADVASASKVVPNQHLMVASFELLCPGHKRLCPWPYRSGSALWKYEPGRRPIKFLCALR
jgi:hypothetical protein